MNKRTYTLVWVLALCGTLAAQPQRGIKMMNTAFDKFLQSKALLTKDTHWSHGMDEYYFKVTAQGDTLPMPKPLQKLLNSFSQSTQWASAAFFHQSEDGKAPFNSLTYQRADNYFAGITGYFSFEDDCCFRIVNFTVDGQLTSYGLKWRQIAFADREGRPYRTIDGVVFRLFDGIWTMRPPFNSGNMAYGDIATQSRSLSQYDEKGYETLHRQMQYLAGQYAEMQKKGDEMGCDAVVYYIQKLCKDFTGRLTEQQYLAVKDELRKVTAEQNSERQRIVSDCNMRLWRQTDNKLPTTSHFAFAHDGDFVKPSQWRYLQENYKLDSVQRQRIRVTLSGQASAHASEVQVKTLLPYEQKPYTLMPNLGLFSFSSTFDQGQLLKISDNQGRQLFIFADSIDTEVRLSDGMLRGSALNERFARCQQRLLALKPELHRYACWDRGGWEVMDQEGYNRLMDEAHELQLQMARENLDNLIPAFYLSENYSMMTADELKPFLQHGRAYADYVAMQPVWQYYEDLQKRLPGMLFADGQAVDRFDSVHHLSEYIGHGDYVVLHFWSMAGTQLCRRDQRLVKQLYNQYKGKNLQVVSVMTGYRQQAWGEYVRKRDLKYAQLYCRDKEDTNLFQLYGVTALPESILFGPDGRIIACGLSGDDLKAAIERLPLKDRPTQ